MLHETKLVQYCVGGGTWKVKAEEGVLTKYDAVEIGFTGFSGQHVYYHDGSTDSTIQVSVRERACVYISLCVLSPASSPFPTSYIFYILLLTLSLTHIAYTGGELLDSQCHAGPRFGFIQR